MHSQRPSNTNPNAQYSNQQPHQPNVNTAYSGAPAPGSQGYGSASGPPSQPYGGAPAPGSQGYSVPSAQAYGNSTQIHGGAPAPGTQVEGKSGGKLNSFMKKMKEGPLASERVDGRSGGLKVVNE